MTENRFPCVKSCPIWYETNKNKPNQYVEFRQSFTTETAAVRLFVSCDSRAVIYLNDRFVGMVLYDGTEHTCWYETYELTDCRMSEENELRIVVFYQGLSASGYTAVRPQLIFGIQNEDGECLAHSCEETFCRVNGKYQSGPVERNQMGYVWHYDARVPDQEWKPAVCWNEKDREYRPRPIERQKLHEKQKTHICAHGYLSEGDMQEFSRVSQNPVDLDQKIETDRPYYLIVDCEEACTGLLELELDASEGTKICLGWGEHLADQRVRSHIGARYFETSYICKEGNQEFTHYFHRLGLRYLELHIYPAAGGKAECLYAGIRPLMYPVKKHGTLQMKNELHQKIYDVAVRTLHLCMHEHYEDCPWREQALYAMDALNQALCGYYCFEEYQFAAASLELLGEGLREDGFLVLHTPGEDAVTIPYFTFMWVIGVSDYLRYSKDVDFVRKLWPKIEMVVEKRLEECRQGLLLSHRAINYWSFYEWNDLLSGEPIYREKELEERIDAPYQMSFLMMLNAVKEMSRILGYADYEEKLSEIMQQMQSACAALFWDEEKESFLTYAYKEGNGFSIRKNEYAELVQAWAVLSGVVTGQKKEKLLKKLADGQSEWTSCTLSMIRYKYEALLTQPELYGITVFQSIEEIWGKMIWEGATSFWETEDGASAFEGAGSLCHGWSAMPVYFYHAYAIPGGYLNGE